MRARLMPGRFFFLPPLTYLRCSPAGRPALAFPEISLLDQHYKIYHNSTPYTNAFLPNHATNKVHYGESHSITHGFDHPSYGGPQSYHPAADVMCGYRGCFAIFPTQWHLDQHSEVHLTTPLPVSTHLSNYDVNGSRAMFTDQGNHDVAMNSPLSAPPVDYNSYRQAVHDPWSYPTMATPGAAITAGFMPTPHAYNGTNPQDMGNTIAGGLPLPPTSLAPSMPSGTETRYACSFPGCNITCARPGDLRRHTQMHAAGPKRHNCPTPGCPRKGLNGFDRSDKMRSHHSVCSRRVGRGYAQD